MQKLGHRGWSERDAAPRPASPSCRSLSERGSDLRQFGRKKENGRAFLWVLVSAGWHSG